MNIKDENLDDLIQNYAFGRLNDTQASEFEEYFISNPELVEKIELAQYMRTGLIEAEKTVSEHTQNHGIVENKLHLSLIHI